MTIVCVDNTPIMLQSLKENVSKAIHIRMCKHFFLQRLLWTMQKSSGAMCFFAKSILRDWKDFFSQKK